MKTMLGRRIAAALSALILVLFPAGCGGSAFSPEDWKAADQIGRQKMVKTLMREVDPVGWTEEEVNALLGPETSADPDFRCSLKGYDTEDTLVYALGACGPAHVRLLVIALDGARRVTGWELVKIQM